MPPAESCCFSVLVPVYNSAATLPRAVRSALAQDLSDLEVVIINDGSLDQTGEVANQLAASDPRVRVITLPRNRGKSSAMNVGAAEARGRWVAVLDADDWYAPDRLSRLLAAAEQHDVHLVADNQFMFDEGAGQVVRNAFPEQDGDRPLNKATFIVGSNPYSDFDFGMLKPILRAEFIRSNGLAYHENAKLSEDFIYMVDFLAAGGRGWLVGRPSYYWRQAFGSISRRWTETGAGTWRYDYLSAVAAIGEAVRSLQLRGERDLAALLEYRIRAFQRLHWLQEINRLRATGAGPSRLMGCLLRHPSVWPMLAQRGLRRVVRRLPNELAQRA